MTIAIRPPTIGKSTVRRNAATRVPPAPAADATVAPAVAAVVDEDAQMIHAVKKGFLVGTPAVFAIAAGMALVAGTTVGIAAVIGGWSGLFGGWYFGSIFFINSKPKGPKPRS